RSHTHHPSGFRITWDQDAARHLGESSDGQRSLQQAAEVSRPKLRGTQSSHCIEADAVDAGVCEHVQGVGEQPGGLESESRAELHDEHHGVDDEEGPQRPRLRRSIRHRELRSAYWKWSGSDWLRTEAQAFETLEHGLGHPFRMPHADPSLREIEGEGPDLRTSLESGPHKSLLSRAVHLRDSVLRFLLRHPTS